MSVWYHPIKNNFCLWLETRNAVRCEYQGSAFPGRIRAKVSQFIKSQAGLKNNGWVYIGEFD